jgi:hypothetical protein
MAPGCGSMSKRWQATPDERRMASRCSSSASGNAPRHEDVRVLNIHDDSRVLEEIEGANPESMTVPASASAGRDQGVHGRVIGSTTGLFGQAGRHNVRSRTFIGLYRRLPQRLISTRCAKMEQ